MEEIPDLKATNTQKKNRVVYVHLDETQFNVIQNYARQNNTSKSRAMREILQSVIDEAEKERNQAAKELSQSD